MTEIASNDGAGFGLREVKTALGDFVSDFKNFQNRIETRLKTQDDRIALLDRKSVARPALAAETAAPEAKAMAAYLRSGDESGLQVKGLSTATGAEGGYLVNDGAATRIQSALKSATSLRAVARVAQVESANYEVLIERGELSTGWQTESAAATESTGQTIDRIRIPLHELAAMPKASQRLLEDAAFDVESWLIDRIVERFAAAESAAFINGDGVNKPRGVLHHAKIDNASWAWGSIGYVKTGVKGNFNTADPSGALVDLVYSLGSRYRANAAFVMNSKTGGVLRKFKDADGRFLWMEGLNSGEPPRLLGHRVIFCEDMPDIATDATPIAFGDFDAGYTIAERPGLRVLRDPYSAKPHVQFYAASRIGGDVTDFAAIKLLKFSDV